MRLYRFLRTFLILRMLCSVNYVEDFFADFLCGFHPFQWNPWLIHITISKCACYTSILPRNSNEIPDGNISPCVDLAFQLQYFTYIFYIIQNKNFTEKVNYSSSRLIFSFFDRETLKCTSNYELKFCLYVQNSVLINLIMDLHQS